MAEEKKSFPYRVGKGNRPKIEEIINYCLDGELKQSALDFAAWLRNNEMPINLHSSTTRGHNARFKGEYICHILIYGQDDWKHVQMCHPGDPIHWTVTLVLNHMNEYQDKIKDEGLQINFNDVIWRCTHGSHGNGKGRCDPGKPCAGGRDLTIFGDGYDGICMWLWPRIKNPDEAVIKKIKRLLELEKKARSQL